MPPMQPAIPYNSRRHHDLNYAPPPPQYRPPYSGSPYQGYHYPQNGGPPPHLPLQYGWYPYHQMQQPLPPRQYQAPYTPLVVSSYPQYSPSPSSPYRPQIPQQVPPPSMPPQAMLSPPTLPNSPHIPTPPPETLPREPIHDVPPPIPQTATTTTVPTKPVSEKPKELSSSPINFKTPPLPWLSRPNEDFPPRAPRRRRKRHTPGAESIAVKFPERKDVEENQDTSPTPVQPAPVAVSEAETPATSNPPSEVDSTHPTTPSSAVPQTVKPSPTTQSKSSRGSVLPIIPAVPKVPKSPVTPKHSHHDSISAHSTSSRVVAQESSNDDSVITPVTDTTSATSEQTATPARAPPKSWADLVRTNAPKKAPSNTASKPTNIGTSKSETLNDVLNNLGGDGLLDESRIAFLEPRGLVNTGNMCYMNSVLQILVFCIPFFQFLDQIGKKAAHSFKSDTPLVDALIMFMREFRVIDSAPSVEQLRLRLKETELEQYGEAFIPEYVYEVIRQLPRFSSMRRGHQQDAEEFLGFLLEGLHEECVRVMKSNANPGESAPAIGSASPDGTLGSNGDVGWLEVGPKQKAAITRSSGMVVTESPITKIFGGKIRSEFRVPGLQNSVTLEPYQPLQLDIGSPQVNNIMDALKNLTRPETIHGDFNSPRGPGATATKQVYIETLPPVLIIHLKRFQYDNTGGTQKIWKKVGYPLDLEIPKEVFPQHRRGAMTATNSFPKYRLIGVVYHHGKNASGGHYTVDVRRQEGREWIRLDDTAIRRVRSEDVAEGGSEEDPKVLAAALEQHKNKNSNSNKFEQMTVEDDEVSNEAGWSQVNGGSAAGTPGVKKWSGVVNGNSTPTSSSGKRSPHGKYSVKDNKVAYLLFYQKIKN
ncbi:MAG: hypothetical protein M1834_007015 [Cirrosporium novae-zelandiae]|nr:MAG: hypothetical protein M1834_007015 [Cirrosporium novae-zelandiae]